MLRGMLLIVAMSALVGLTDVTVPTTDRKGSKDSPLLKRYEGSIILAYDTKAFDALSLPTSALVLVPDATDRMNNRRYAPKTKKDLEGRYTRLVYLIPPERSPLEVLRNYQDDIKSKGGKILFECKEEECGGEPGRTSGGGGGDMSLAMYLYPGDRITDQQHTIGRCVQEENVSGQRYMTAEQTNAHVGVHTYTIVSPDPHGACKPVNERTIAVVHLVETKAREEKMVTVKASEMATAISTTGRVALYGIFFDFNKADLKPESDPTLEQIGQLLKSTPALKVLVVGHTDNVGSFAFNMDLSQRRAAAVVATLASRYGIAKDRLSPVGVSFASPVAPNTTEEGRAKNRRVELVDQATTSSGKTN